MVLNSNDRRTVILYFVRQMFAGGKTHLFLKKILIPIRNYLILNNQNKLVQRSLLLIFL